jgi:GDP-4-dehydro-6-deoxy-D-mannose reductase
MSRLKILITGAGGFVGSHLVDELRRRLVNAEICATTLRPRATVAGSRLEQLDVTDAAAVAAVVADFRPTHVVHLAGLTTLAAAEADYRATWQLHLFGTLNIANAILALAPDCVFLCVGSGEVYGASAQTGLPLDETAVLAPMSEYAATKAAADLALGAMVQKGLRSIRLRPFNHTGPGQSDRFVIPSFARQIAGIEAGSLPPLLKVGNVDAERDFLDVRDVVSAYVSAITASDHLPAGLVLNIASGVPVRIRALLDKLLALSTCTIRVEKDAARMRANDTPRYVGDATRARLLLNWSPRYQIDETLGSVLDYFRVGGANSPPQS